MQVPLFVDSMYQWAATIGQSGANYPTILPLKVDKLPNGFQASGRRADCCHWCTLTLILIPRTNLHLHQVSFLKRMDSAGRVAEFGSAGDIQGLVEAEEGGKASVLRFYDGPASFVGRRWVDGSLSCSIRTCDIAEILIPLSSSPLLVIPLCMHAARPLLPMGAPNASSPSSLAW